MRASGAILAVCLCLAAHTALSQGPDMAPAPDTTTAPNAAPSPDTTPAPDTTQAPDTTPAPETAPAPEAAPAQETAPVSVTTAPPGREVSFPASEVKDTFFAYFLGIIRAGAEMDIDNEQMRAILVEFKSTLNVPFDLIAGVSQHEDPASSRREIAVAFRRDVIIPIPFAILWYHPGRITSTRTLSFDVHRSFWADPAAPNKPGEVFDLVLARGSVLVQIDGWVKAVLSGHLEDTWIRHVVFFRWYGHWIGMLAGTGRETGKMVRAYFDFTKNEILFPAPDPLRDAGHDLVPDPPP
ncbi:MAG: hypothetical protein ACLQDL_00375 [Spirochaetia bacterium]